MFTELTILVPVYNEEDNLSRLFDALLSYLYHANRPAKVLFINDGSTDSSKKIITKFCNDHRSFDYIDLIRNQGLSAALKAGFDQADTALIGYLDADLQTTPEDFNLLLDYINDYDLVTGIRVKREDPIIKIMVSRIANVFRRLITKDGIKDTGCPLKIIKSNYAKQMPMFEGLHRFIPALVLLQHGKVKQVPVKHFSRKAGRSNFGIWKRMLEGVSSCVTYVRIKKNYKQHPNGLNF